MGALQSREVAYRGRFVAAVVAQSLEAAQDAASRIVVRYEPLPHDVTLTAGHPGLYKPDFVNPRYRTDAGTGDFDGAYAAAAVRVDATYTTPAGHNHPMEPHATIAAWDGDTRTLHDATQGPSRAARPVKCAVTRAQMAAVTGHRAPSIQRVRLGAGPDGRLTAVGHDVTGQTSGLKEFTEQSAVATRRMCAAPHRRTTHRVVRLDVPTPSWMRAPGECPGMFALESALDELAQRCGIDPVELRLRNDPAVHPETDRKSVV